tara:strand:+ start:2274 stop:3827 length:1554 start_codon:yes stop_codon:yes gene_type:complete
VPAPPTGRGPVTLDGAGWQDSNAAGSERENQDDSLLPESSLYGWLAALLVVGFIGLQILVACLVLLRPHRRQSSSLAWLIVLLLLPGLGLLGWFLFGEVRVGRSRVARHRRIQDEVRRALITPFATCKGVTLDETFRSLAELGHTVCETDPRPGNQVDLFANTGQAVQRLIDDIDGAADHVHLLFYIWLPDDTGKRVAEAVLRATERGVACRILVDALGSRSFLESSLPGALREAGAQVVAALEPPFLPLLTARVDLRNHRKIAVIDHDIGYTGSQNLADAAFAPKAKYAPWVDTMLRLEGPAVADLQELFIEDWYLDTNESLADLLRIPAPREDGIPVQVMGTGPNSVNDALVQILQASIHLAREEVILTTPYFVPDEGTLSALSTAARRGVEVTLVVPHKNDSFLVAAASRSFYEPLLTAGVKVLEYTAGLLHAKTMTVDRQLAYVGSANLDRRSFEINFEISTMLYDSDFASHLRLLQRTYMDSTIAIHPERWMQRRWYNRVGQNAAGLLGPLL